jgi:hypothetical protein
MDKESKESGCDESSFGVLSDDVVFHILKFTDPEKVRELKILSKRFNDLVNGNVIFCLDYFLEYALICKLRRTIVCVKHDPLVRIHTNASFRRNYTVSELHTTNYVWMITATNYNPQKDYIIEIEEKATISPYHCFKIDIPIQYSAETDGYSSPIKLSNFVPTKVTENMKTVYVTFDYSSIGTETRIGATCVFTITAYLRINFASNLTKLRDWSYSIGFPCKDTKEYLGHEEKFPKSQEPN